VNKRTKIKITGDYIILKMSYIIHTMEGERRKEKGERKNLHRVTQRSTEVHRVIQEKLCATLWSSGFPLCNFLK
jgi:hypothetical protein